MQEFVKERYTIVKPKKSRKAKASTKTTYDRVGEKLCKTIPYEKFRKLNGDGKLDLYTSNRYKPRATAIAELFFKSMYIEEDGTDEV